MNLYAGYFAMHGGIDPMGLSSDCDDLQNRIDLLNDLAGEHAVTSSNINGKLNELSGLLPKVSSALSLTNSGASLGGTAGSYLHSRGVGMTTKELAKKAHVVGGSMDTGVTEAVRNYAGSTTYLNSTGKTIQKGVKIAGAIGVAGIGFDGVSAVTHYSSGNTLDGNRSVASGAIGTFAMFGTKAMGATPVTAAVGAVGQMAADAYLLHAEGKFNDMVEGVYQKSNKLSDAATERINQSLSKLQSEYAKKCGSKCKCK